MFLWGVIGVGVVVVTEVAGPWRGGGGAWEGVVKSLMVVLLLLAERRARARPRRRVCGLVAIVGYWLLCG